uniref:Reverse transcriptase domain-containing protein n=1 Tax=Tanacetum cinerariifolium TaxID=118510 RepID=A0A6L2MLG3_TANCI|nr:reverse transcriptase domain-containing protein [Tanacetum cinerariifolium]
MADNRIMEELLKHPRKGMEKLLSYQKLMRIILRLRRIRYNWENASKTDDRIDKLADQILTLVDIFAKKVVTLAAVKAVEESYVTCGGNHVYYNCDPTNSNQSSVCAEMGTYNQVAPQNHASNYMAPPGFAPGEMKAITIRSGVAYETLPKPNIPYPLRLNDQNLYEKAKNQMEKFFQIFQDLHFDISFADALILMPKFASTIKSLLANKDKLFKLAKIPLNENCSAMLLKKLLEKLGDPGKFLIPCDFSRMDVCHALADLGASINLMPLSIWKKISLPELTPTRMTLELADRSTTRPKGVTEDVFVKVGKSHFPTEFVVIDFEADLRVPLIIRRSFLRTGRALIDVYGKEITLRVNDEAVIFNLNQTMRYSSTYDDMSVNRIDVIDVAKEVKSVQSKEPKFKVADSDLPQDQEKNPGNDNEEPKKNVASKRNWFTKPTQPQEPTNPDWNVGKTLHQGQNQSWLMTLASSAEKPSRTFDELMSTSIDFYAFIMNGLNINNLTQETLLGPVFRLLKGTHSNYVRLEYDFEKCYKAFSEKLNSKNPKGDNYPFDLTKPIPLVKIGNIQKVSVDYFFNNDLKYLQGGISTMTYTNSLTKTKAAQYDLSGIEDMVEILRKHGYGYLQEIVVRRVDNDLYRFKEGDIPRLRINDIQDMLLLVVQNRLTNLSGDDVSDFAIALRMFTRSLVIQNRVEDLQLRVESYQKKINVTKPETTKSRIKKRDPYTPDQDRLGFIYVDDSERNRLMRSDELYKFSDGILTTLQASLSDITKNIRMEYLPKRRWSTLEKKRANIMIKAQNHICIDMAMMNISNWIEVMEDYNMAWQLISVLELLKKEANMDWNGKKDTNYNLIKHANDIECDENSKFFHGLIKQKRRAQMIHGIMKEGVWISDPSQIKKEFLNFFKEKLKDHDSNVDFPSFANSFELCAIDRDSLETHVSLDEVKNAGWDCGIIIEYLVKISKKARILELKQRHLKMTVMTSNTPYPSKEIRHIYAYTSQKTTKKTRSIHRDDEVEITDEESSYSDDEVAKIFRIETNAFDFKTPLYRAFKEFNYILEDEYCNEGNFLGACIVGNTLCYQDLEWYDALKYSELKEEALKNKAIMEGMIDDNDESSNDG